MAAHEGAVSSGAVQPAGERGAFLAAATGGDDVLRREVESLLMWDATDGSVLERPASATMGRTLSHPAPAAVSPYEVVAALDAALQAREAVHPRKSQVVELRFFGGVSIDETAEALKVSPETVKRDWKLAKLWLLGVRGEQGVMSANSPPKGETV